LVHGGFGQVMSMLLSQQAAYLAASLLPLVLGALINGVSPTLHRPLMYGLSLLFYARWAEEGCR